MVFLAAAIVCGILNGFVGVNYDMKDYLPDDSPSTAALNKMQEEFAGGIPNARVMVRNVQIPEALEYKEALAQCTGVTDVIWLDDAVNIYQPLETQDQDTVEAYYKEETALFTVTIEEEKRIEAVDEIRSLIGEENAMTGDAVSSAIATTSTEGQIRKITVFAVLVVFFILTLTTTSWVEPLIVLFGLGVAILINSGSNLIFGEISFVTNAAGAVLQLAVSLDYSVFLIHRFEECLLETPDSRTAMVNALCKSTSSILSSGLTTVIGFLALLFMRFGIGPDLGTALAKGVAISLTTVFVFMPCLILVSHELMRKTHHKKFLPEFDKFGRFVSHVMIPMAGTCVIVMVPGFLASNQNSFYYGASRIFGEDTQLGADTQAVEEIFGKCDAYVVLIPNGDADGERQLSDALHGIREISSIISYTDTVGSSIPMEYLDESVLSQLVSENYSRMVLTVEADYEGEETFDLVEQIRDTAEEYYPGTYYLAGEGVSTYDLMDTITADTMKVNLIAIGAVFAVLLLTMQSVTLPVILVLSIETAIWINMAIPYFTDSVVFYIAYLIISSIQLGATVDYAILFTDRYLEQREKNDRKEAIIKTIAAVTPSLLTSGTVMAVVGFLLGYISTHGILSQLGTFLGKGTLLSLSIVLFVLPGFLFLADKLVEHTTRGIHFYHKGEKIK